MIKTGFSGEFRIEVRNAYTHQLTKVREFTNTITDAGLNAYGAGYTGLLGRCWVGSGNTPISTSNTGLSKVIAYSDGAGTNEVQILAPAQPNWVAGAKLKYHFEPGKIVGNITEVGIGTRNESSANNYALWSRALVLNSDGSPSSITVLADEYMDVYYILKLHPNLEDIKFSFDLNGVVYNCVARPANVQNTRCNVDNGNLSFGTGITILNVYNSNTLGAITETIKGFDKYVAPNGSQTIDPYTAGNFYRDCTIVIPVNNGNIDGGIKGLDIGPNGNGNQLMSYTQVSLDKAIPKTKDNAIKFVLRTSWSRYTP